jgi:hypothetical protein
MQNAVLARSRKKAEGVKSGSKAHMSTLTRDQRQKSQRRKSQRLEKKKKAGRETKKRNWVEIEISANWQSKWQTR